MPGCKDLKDLLLDLGDEVEFDAFGRKTIHGALVLVIANVSELLLAIATIIGNFDYAVVLEASLHVHVNDLGILGPADPEDPRATKFAGNRRFDGAKISIDMARTLPDVAMPAIKRNWGRVGHRRVQTLQVPVGVADIALDNLLLVQRRLAALHAKDGIALCIHEPGVVGHLVPAATALVAA